MWHVEPLFEKRAQVIKGDKEAPQTQSSEEEEQTGAEGKEPALYWPQAAVGVLPVASVRTHSAVALLQCICELLTVHRASVAQTCALYKHVGQ